MSGCMLSTKLRSESRILSQTARLLSEEKGRGDELSQAYQSCRVPDLGGAAVGPESSVCGWLVVESCPAVVRFLALEITSQ